MKRWAVLMIAVAAAGAIVALVAGDSKVATALAIALIGCAAVGAVSLAFFAIGEAEDRDREAEAAEAAKAAEAERRGPPQDPHPRTLGLGPDRRAPRPPRRPQ